MHKVGCLNFVYIVVEGRFYFYFIQKSLPLSQPPLNSPFFAFKVILFYCHFKWIYFWRLVKLHKLLFMPWLHRMNYLLFKFHIIHVVCGNYELIWIIMTAIYGNVRTALKNKVPLVCSWTLKLLVSVLKHATRLLF